MAPIGSVDYSKYLFTKGITSPSGTSAPISGAASGGVREPITSTVDKSNFLGLVAKNKGAAAVKNPEAVQSPKVESPSNVQAAKVDKDFVLRRFGEQPEYRCAAAYNNYNALGAYVNTINAQSNNKLFELQA